MYRNGIWLLVCLVVSACSLIAEPENYPAPDSRPTYWAQPLALHGMENCYQIDSLLIRCEQPSASGFKALEEFGIQHSLNLRQYHSDDDEAAQTSVALHRLPMSADDVSSSQLLQAVELIEQLKEPVVVHCWHGSDRTGAVVAAYRILKQGWSKEQAINEMVNGGYGFHLIYWDIVKVLEQLPES